MENKFYSNSESDTLKIASDFALELSAGDIVLLDGDLGAGKTVFSKGIVSALSNGKINAVSPTFVLVNVYETDPPVYHFDLYRIKDVGELDAIGAEEYFYSDGISLIEWPSRAEDIFPDSVIKVYIEKVDNEKRVIKIERWVMKTLIIDCSAGMSVYVLKDDEVFSKIDKNQKKHTDELLFVVDELLQNANIKINEIDNICVCVGPGSFTGIRVAISIVKGLAIELKAKVFVSTNFDVLQEENNENAFYILDGFSKFLYLRTVRNGVIFDECIDVENLIFKLKNSNFKIYVENEKVQNILNNNEILSNIAKNNTIFHFLNKISNNDTIDLNKIEPVYLRASQAEIERNKKLSGNNNG